MSEYQYVESPLINHLASMGWQVYEQNVGIPKDPALTQDLLTGKVRENTSTASLSKTQ